MQHSIKLNPQQDPGISYQEHFYRADVYYSKSTSTIVGTAYPQEAHNLAGNPSNKNRVYLLHEAATV